jgi:GNAT superfamily N-acetyltransferase
MRLRSLVKEDLPMILAIQAELYEAQKASSIGLPAFEERQNTLRAALMDLIENHPAIGLFDEDVLISYMTGYSGIHNMKGTQIGVFTPEWAHGMSPGAGVENYEKMFAALWQEWQFKGIRNHAISNYPIQNELRNFCFDMAYGKIVEDGVCDLETWKPAELGKCNLTIRKAQMKDLDQLWLWETRLIDYLNKSPIYRYGERPVIDTRGPGYKAAFLGEQVITLVCVYDGRLLGAIRGKTGETTNSEWVRHAKNVAVDFAWTEQEQRSLGIGRRLVEALKASAKTIHATSCSVDYETHNTLAKVFWRKHFSPFCESLVRKIDDRL